MTAIQEVILTIASTKRKKSPAVRCHSQINVVCLFIGFCYFYFPGSVDFPLLIQPYKCCPSFLVVSSGYLEHLMRTVPWLWLQSVFLTVYTS